LESGDSFAQTRSAGLLIIEGSGGDGDGLHELFPCEQLSKFHEFQRAILHAVHGLGRGQSLIFSG
jgi:hypothetical protein